jgi:diadenosine tetraphosphate (Ap4A) HIT family hydrolase
MEDAHGSAVGVIGLPAQQEIVYAGRGLGCWLLRTDVPGRDALRVQVGDRAELRGALTLTANQHMWTQELVAALHAEVALVGGVHHAIAHLVTGRVDLVVATGWDRNDLAPLPVLVREAGGAISSLSGAQPLPGEGTVLAGNPVLHTAALGLVSDLPATRGTKALTAGSSPSSGAQAAGPAATLPDCALCTSEDAALDVVTAWSDATYRLLVDLHSEVAGCSLLTPMRHVGELDDLEADELAQLGPALAHCIGALKRATGATTVFTYVFDHPHLHIHLAPHTEDDALSRAVIRGEVTQEDLDRGGGMHRNTSTTFPVLPREELRALAEVVRVELS